MATAATTPALSASPAKLRDGSWGARIESSDVSVGTEVVITTRAGKSWDAWVADIIWTKDGITLARTRSSKAAPERSKSTSSGGRCRDCRGPIRNSAHHRAMGGLCGSCAFDEYDC